MAPAQIARTPGGGVAIFDIGRFSVELFGPKGEYLRKVQLEKPVVNPKGFAVLPDGAFLLTGGIRGEALAIHRFAPDGSLAGSWQPVATLRPAQVALYTAGGPITIAPGGEILFSQAAPHRIVAFTPAGQLLHVIAADSVLLPRVGDEFVIREGSKRRFRWDFPQSRGIFRLEDGSVLNVIAKDEDGVSIWEVYGPDGHLVGRTQVARAYEPWGMTADGGILASYRAGPLGPSTAVKLRVTIGHGSDPAHRDQP
ncbi:MAG: hypothetical protein IRY91_08870 [Gemmatimonadaceae bacterium]|nr:hypothetical protein [Gemmatimonadaceae bacterium]